MSANAGSQANVAAVRLIGPPLVALVAVSPTMMTAVMNRGHEIPKLMVAAFLAALILAMAFATVRWREVFRADWPVRMACVAIMVFLCIAGAGTALSLQPTATFFGSFFRLEGLLAWLIYGAVFLGAFAWVRSGAEVLSLVDAVLLASVVPACYAVMQSLDLDFYLVAGRDPSRANGTQGNPIQLAEYLAYLIPLTLARIWLAMPGILGAVAWVVVLAFQLSGLWLTQTRGPLVAAVAAVMLLFLFGAAAARRRRWFAGVGLSVIAGVVFVVVINASTTAGTWAQSVPFLNRMVFKIGPDAAASTSLASRSIVARLGIWQAGADTYAASALSRQILGYGPESAFVHYYPHIPASVLRSEDFRVTAIFDRLHADSLDVGLNFGAAGWLAYLVFFGVVVFAAARGMFGAAALISLPLYTFLTVACAVAAAGVAGGLGFPQAAMPAACLGMGGGWLLFFAIASWRFAGRAPEAGDARHGQRDWMLAGALVCSLLAFWIDAQINIPLLTSRIVSFVVAALLVSLATRLALREWSSGMPGGSGRSLVEWGVAMSLVAALASFLPLVATDKTAYAIPELGLRLTPIVALCLVASMAFQSERLVSAPPATWKRHALLVFGVPLAYCALHIFLRVNVESGYGPETVPRVAALVALGPVFIWATSIAASFALSGRTCAGERYVTRLRGAIAVLVALVGSGACFGTWEATQADIAATSASWAVVREKGTADRLLQTAIDIEPHEWQYRRLQIHRKLEYALAVLGGGATGRERYVEFKAYIDTAEAMAREAVRLDPRNPWPRISLANVLQVRALRLIRAFDVAGGEAAELEADDTFRVARDLFPAQPVIYRNWAQLKFDGGYPEEGYRLLGVMESIIPGEPEPYIERIQMARRFGHIEEARSVLDRAEKRLGADAFDLVRNVANAPQNGAPRPFGP